MAAAFPDPGPTPDGSACRPVAVCCHFTRKMSTSDVARISSPECEASRPMILHSGIPAVEARPARSRIIAVDPAFQASNLQ